MHAEPTMTSQGKASPRNYDLAGVWLADVAPCYGATCLVPQGCQLLGSTFPSRTLVASHNPYLVPGGTHASTTSCAGTMHQRQLLTLGMCSWRVGTDRDTLTSNWPL